MSENTFNILHAYFRLKGHPFKADEPAHREVWRMNLKYAKKIMASSGNDYEAAIGKMERVAEWARSNKLDWTLSTVLKRWLETNDPAPKQAYYLEGVKKFKAQQFDGKWKAMIDGKWRVLNTRYLNLKECIVYE